MRVTIPRLVIAGAASGVGKTTTCVAIARALQNRGLKVALFKCGPDYLDPTYHARAVNRASHNLDAWMMGREAVLATFERQSQGCDLAIIEGVMGLYDGVSPTSDEGSTAALAKWLKAPVIAVLDASGMARTVAALAAGLAHFDADVDVCAIVTNFVGSRRHLELLQAACVALPCVGGFVRDAGPSFAQRHLGLQTASHKDVAEQNFDAWAQAAETWIDLDAVLTLARRAPALPIPPPPPSISADGATKNVRIGLVRDEALHFYYDHNLSLLQAAGATLVEFSLIHDTCLPDVDGLYLGGGYPEVHASVLANNHTMLKELRDAAQQGLPIYAECGGLMVLCNAMITTDGQRHAMANILPFQAVMHDRLQMLGYADVETTCETVIGAAKQRFRGHQFRYSRLEPLEKSNAPAFAYRLTTTRTAACVDEGYQPLSNVLASYVHAHWASCPQAAQGLVNSCRRYAARVRRL